MLGEGQAHALREREAALQTAARGPVPREGSRARWLGEGQALALRRGKHALVKKSLQVL